ncbi:phage regulator Rha-like protein [Janthinobacterium sp. 61]|uniref:Rha family transcriptional regulator n=1 Tax=Janthinobacterium sp. 61 TaxID=2035209 RepID=UPI000CC8590A|nr:Rha family transcriptional regulator [Janthinobacterium sp. 61]PKV43639.1 phage regulator Rha-like protein [Janthinobacterium sp. 61]
MTPIVQQHPTMTSREIAELTGSTHDAVLKTIRRLLAEGVVSGNETPYKHPQNSQTYSEFLLSFRDTMVVVSGYSAELRAKIIDRWQELEAKQLATPAAAPKPSAISPAKEFRAIFGIARLIGLDKNAAAISANQGTAALTGVNMLQLMERTHLATPEQEICFTPTEMGRRFVKSAKDFNQLLAQAGLQEQIAGHWVPTAKGRAHAVVLDTGKAHSSGTPIQQVKWRDSVLAEVAL